jgi:hypothetical protein
MGCSSSLPKDTKLQQDPPAAGGSHARLSIASEKALSTIESCEAHLKDLTAQVEALESAPEDVSVLGLTKHRNLCHHVNGLLEKFQYVKVDSVITADLSSGKDEAKTRRKDLNASCDRLRARIDARALNLDKLIDNAKTSQEGGSGDAANAV